MKKLLLSMAAIALGAASMSATSYTLYNNKTAKGTWTAEGKGFTTTVTVDGKSFTLKTDQGSSKTKCVNPGENISWKVYQSL